MQTPSVTPPWTGVGKKIESMTRKALFDYQMIPSADPIAVALSGGKDSLTLLLMLKAISGRGFPSFNLHAVHVSGAFSCGAGVNTDFLKRICDMLDVNLIIKESHQTLETLECYSCSRNRRALLFEGAKSVGAKTIAFGHHRDDNVQTLLMNLLHKAEFCGNLANLPMQDFGVTIVRPLTYVSEDDIRSFAKLQGFARIMCKCPVGQNSYRKKTEDLIKQIEHLYPNARKNIASAVHNYGSDKAKRR